MKKIVLELLKLFWKFLQVVVWKWLRPWIGRFVGIFLGGIVLLTLLTVILARSC